MRGMGQGLPDLPLPYHTLPTYLSELVTDTPTFLTSFLAALPLRSSNGRLYVRVNSFRSASLLRLKASHSTATVLQ